MSFTCSVDIHRMRFYRLIHSIGRRVNRRREGSDVHLINIVDQRLKFFVVHEFKLIIKEHQMREKAVEVRMKVQEDNLSEVTMINVGQDCEEKSNDLLDVAFE